MKYFVSVDINGGEYEGQIIIETPKKLKQVDERTVKTNGVTIKFDEQILRIEE
jgi:hypothetical protein